MKMNLNLIAFIQEKFGFRAQHFLKEIRQFIKIIITNIYRIYAYHSIMDTFVLNLLILREKMKVY